MFILPSSANSTTTLSLPPSVLAVTSSNAVSTRTTTVALPAPLSDEAIADNAQNNAAVSTAVATEDSATTASAGNFSASGLASNLSSSGPSSTFLAQFFAQSTDTEADTTEQVTAHFAPAPEYNTFVGYGYIKYKPSNAGIPPQRSPLPSPVVPSAPQPSVVVTEPDSSNAETEAGAVPVAAPQVSSANTTSAASDQSITEPVSTITFNAPISFSPPANENTPSAVGNADTVTFPVPAAAAAQPGVTANAASSNVQAYSQTQSRNQTNLSPAEPQLVVAG